MKKITVTVILIIAPVMMFCQDENLLRSPLVDYATIWKKSFIYIKSEKPMKLVPVTALIKDMLQNHKLPKHFNHFTKPFPSPKDSSQIYFTKIIISLIIHDLILNSKINNQTSIKKLYTEIVIIQHQLKKMDFELFKNLSRAAKLLFRGNKIAFKNQLNKIPNLNSYMICNH
tara:strand:+ start:178 stop:693 length:516 start_codon:yes stop_codon:yes gene_type:complete